MIIYTLEQLAAAQAVAKADAEMLSYLHDEPTGDLYDPPLNDPAARRVLTIEVGSRDHAQAMVDLMSWALGAGARTSDGETVAA